MFFFLQFYFDDELRTQVSSEPCWWMTAMCQRQWLLSPKGRKAACRRGILCLFVLVSAVNSLLRNCFEVVFWKRHRQRSQSLTLLELTLFFFFVLLHNYHKKMKPSFKMNTFYFSKPNTSSKLCDKIKTACRSTRSGRTGTRLGDGSTK